MFLGHYAAALAAKRLAPRTSLGTLVLAAQLIDLVWPALVLLGVERVRVAPGITAFTPLDFEHYPWTHSALAVAVWSGLAAGLYRWRTGYGRGAAVVAGAVASHWLLDVLSHRPDLPLAPGGGPKVGLGLWHSVPATLAVELGLFLGGLALYLATTRARDRTGRLALAALAGFLLLVYAGNVLGPPPPGPREIGMVSLLLWLLVPWAAWIDRHREPHPRFCQA